MRKGNSCFLPAAWYFLSFLVGGCVSGRPPSVIKHNTSMLSPGVSYTPAPTWTFENLKPDEKETLTDGTTIPFSVDLKGSGDAKYVVTFTSNRKELHPSILEVKQGLGEIEFSETITWLVHLSGKNETAIVALYRIEESESGKTQVRTLVKQIRRQYSVVCDKNKNIVILFLKELFDLCTCERGQCHQKQ